MNEAQAPRWLPEVLIPFFTLSYPTARPANPDSFPDAQYYGTGRLDACLVLTWILVLGVTREYLRLKIFEPFSRQYLYFKNTMGTGALDSALKVVNGVANGIVTASESPVYDHQENRKELPSPSRGSEENLVRKRQKGINKATRIRERSALRCAEQGWQLMYYLVYWPLGLYIHWALPSAPFRLEKLWLDYPHIPLAGPLKLYYLMQLGFWIHQVLLLNAEAWRKDHIQMMSHHVITIFLVVASYYFNLTRVGVLIMVLMDWCDIFLALAKITRYLQLPEEITNGVFAVFVLSWVATRHILFSIVIYHAYAVFPQLIPFAWIPEKGHYVTRNTYVAFIGLMVALQFILFLWLVMLVRLTWKVLKGTPAKDVRSDDGSESDGEYAGSDSTKNK